MRKEAIEWNKREMSGERGWGWTMKRRRKMPVPGQHEYNDKHMCSLIVGNLRECEDF
jgi:hypothetical protein